tara:strand:- start:307 stop:636 length:330 start_codon:yes stop_codon:yes gene_type:complete
MDIIKDKKDIYCSASEAILELVPNSSFAIKGDDLSTLDWQDKENTQPSDSAITAKMAELETKWNNIELARLNRQLEYPAIVDQLDKIYHEGIDAWKVDIKAVKDKYPKT